MPETKIERAWLAGSKGGLEAWQEISRERAAMDLANAHGADAVNLLHEKGTLETRFGHYRIVPKG